MPQLDSPIVTPQPVSSPRSVPRTRFHRSDGRSCRPRSAEGPRLLLDRPRRLRNGQHHRQRHPHSPLRPHQTRHRRGNRHRATHRTTRRSPLGRRPRPCTHHRTPHAHPGHRAHHPHRARRLPTLVHRPTRTRHLSRSAHERVVALSDHRGGDHDRSDHLTARLRPLRTPTTPRAARRGLSRPKHARRRDSRLVTNVLIRHFTDGRSPTQIAREINLSRSAISRIIGHATELLPAEPRAHIHREHAVSARPN